MTLLLLSRTVIVSDLVGIASAADGDDHDRGNGGNAPYGYGSYGAHSGVGDAPSHSPLTS